jgi:hypothetical protein
MRQRLLCFRSIAAAAVACLPAGQLTAQAVERTDTPRRGALRVTFEPRITTWEDVFTRGGQQTLGAGFAGDSIRQWRPAVALAEANVRAATGLAGYVARLGGSLLAMRSERRVTPIQLEYGITSRLSLGATIPIVRVEVHERYRFRPEGSNLGLLPDRTRYTGFFGHLGTALDQLSANINAGAYGSPGSPTYLRAQALLAQGRAFASACSTAVYDTTARFLPIEGSDAGRGLTAIVLGLQRALVDTFNVATFSRDTFFLPVVPVPGDAAAGILADSLSRLGLTLYGPGTPRRLRYFPGDAEVAAKYRLLSGDAYSAAVALVVRLPTGHQDSPNDPFDISTGDHQTDVEGRVTTELTLLHRLWLNLSVRGARQLPGERERLVGPVNQPFLPRATQQRLRWDPGDYMAVDVAPMYRFSRLFAAGLTFGYFTQQRDRYAFLSPADSQGVATAAGGPVSATVLEPGTGIRQARVGLAATFSGPRLEGGFSVERTISGAGGPVPVATVFRIVMRQTILLF